MKIKSRRLGCFISAVFALLWGHVSASDTGLTKRQVADYLAVQAALAGKPASSSDLKKKVDDLYPNHPDGKALKIEQVKTIVTTYTVGVTSPDPTPPDEEKKTLDPLWGFKIRQDYNDVVEDEDKTVKEPKEKRNQLAGASLSFSRNYVSDADTWAFRGALIRPFRLPWTEEEPGLQTGYSDWLYFYLTPSVSLYKVTNDNDSKGEVDSLIYRLGASANYTVITENVAAEYEFRAFATYATDTSHDAETFAAEFDIEPRLMGRGEDAKLALGKAASLMPHTPAQDKGWDTSDFIYHLRLFGHGEVGNVERIGDNPDIQTGSFFRFGPVAKLELQPRFLARSFGMDPRAITAQVSYSYMPTISGTDVGHDDLFSAGIDWMLFKGKGENEYQKVSLKLLYEKGGLELTKEEVETLTIGLGITF